MKPKLTLVTLLSTALVAAGCGSTTTGSSPGSSSDSQINIADIQPLTGASAQYGRQSLQGSKIAIQNLNHKGGVLGKKLHLIQADDASKASQSTSLMKKYGSDNDVTAIIGPTYSSDFIADAPFAEKYQVVTISAGSTAPWPGSFNKWTFRSSVPGRAYLPKLVSTIKHTAHVNTAAQIWATDNQALAEQGKALNALFAKNSINVTTDQKANNHTTDFHPQITAIMANPPDITSIGLITNGAALFTEQLRSSGYSGKLMATGNTLLDPSLYKASHGAAAGLIVPTSFDATSTKPKVKAFVSAFKAKYHHVPNAQQAFGYDAVLLLAHAIKTAGSTDRNAVRQALAHTNGFQGVQGPFTFHGSGDNVTPSVHVVQLTKAGFVPYPAKGQ
jgi:branched-chain amino acid transport system substrate-binding protein